MESDFKPNRRISTLSRHLQPQQQEIQRQFERQLFQQECCGIVAYVGKDSAIKYLLDGLKILESRGYDSAGISTIDIEQKKLVTTKFASGTGTPVAGQQPLTDDALVKLSKAAHVHSNHTIGIAHTRWATHGAKTDTNAHPHTDMFNRVALVHNGVIENASALKKELISKGFNFTSETDTEVIAQLVGQYLSEGNSLVDSVQKAQSRLEGTWGLAIISRDFPDQIVAASNGSPLLVGIGVDSMFLASEPTAFSQHTKEFIALENGEVAVITAQGHSLDRARAQIASHETPEVSPSPFPHWTIKEILEQPAAISRSLNYGGRILDHQSIKLGGLEAHKEQLLNIHHLIISGCGTSYHAALYGAHLMRFLNSFHTIQVVDSAEVTMETFPRPHGGLLVLSQSGETKDVTRALNIAEELNIPTFSVVNAVRSLIARKTGCGVYLNAGREVAVASTKAFTCQVTVLALIAVWFTQQSNFAEHRRKQVVEALHRLPTNVGMSLNNLREQCQEIAKKFCKIQSCFLLGKGFAEPIAREGALKIKEITYVHAEGYPGGSLKHGPFALITEGIPVFLIILDDQHFPAMKTAAAEVKTRGAYNIIITNLRKESFDSHEVDDLISIPSNGALTALLATIPLQLIAYELALLKGLNPDKPRNLAKSVTVD